MARFLAEACETDKLSSKLEWALHYASLGWPIFPCGPDRPGCDPKASILDGWQRDPRKAIGEPVPATTDPDLIRDLWAREPDANIGFCPDHAGLLVVDIDVKHDPKTFERWEILGITDRDIPETLFANTPSGGRHLYFSGHGRSSVGLIVPGLDIDTRGEKGYVLLPGSTVEGVPYLWAGDFNLAQIAPAPEWILKALEVTHQPARIGELDKPGNVTRATDKLQRYANMGDVATSGRGGNDRTYRLFAELASFNLSPQTSFELVSKHWNPKCMPPWDSEALMTFARNAAKYATGKGNLTTDIREAFAEQIEAAQTLAANDAASPVPSGKARKTRSNFGMVRGRDAMRALPDVKFFLPDLIEEAGEDGAVFLIAGPPGSGKSLIVQQLAIVASAGKDRPNMMTVFGVRPTRFGPAYYMANEGRAGIRGRRMDALCRQLGLPDEEPRDFVLMDTFDVNKEDGERSWQGCVAEIDADIAANGGTLPSMIALDTAVGAMEGMNENDVGDVQRFIRIAREFSKRYRCPVIVVHHTGKDGQIRGSSNWTAGTVGTLVAHGMIKDGPVRYETGRIKEAADDRAFVIEFKSNDGAVPVPTLAADGSKAEVKAGEQSRAKLAYHEASAVGEALQRLGAVRGRPISGTVLAGELRPMDPLIDVDRPTYDRLLVAMEGQFKRQARLKGGRYCLRCYVEKRGEERTAAILWSLPDAC